MNKEITQKILNLFQNVKFDDIYLTPEQEREQQIAAATLRMKQMNSRTSNNKDGPGGNSKNTTPLKGQRKSTSPLNGVNQEIERQAKMMTTQMQLHYKYKDIINKLSPGKPGHVDYPDSEEEVLINEIQKA